MGQSVTTGGAILDDSDVYQAIVKTANEYGIDVADFAFYADELGLTILLKPMDLTELSRVLHHTATEVIADSLDACLRQKFRS